jgi:subtilisin family serine protease
MTRSAIVLLVVAGGLAASCATGVRTTVPNDPGFGQSWWLRHIDASGAWARTVGSPDVLVAVVDRGIDYRHRDLRKNIWHNPGEISNGMDDDANGYVDDLHGIRLCPPVSGDPNDDESGHGTHLAGIIGAEGDNQTDVVGVAWRVSLMAIKIVCPSGSAGDAVRIARGVRYAATQGAQIIQGSWDEGGSPSVGVLDAIREAGHRGAIVVLAAGNRPLDNDVIPNYPASYEADNLVTVTATDMDNALWFRSAFGRRTIHLAAPGVDILSTVPGSMAVDTKTGTSMASAVVAGCAALMKAARPALTPMEIKTVLMRTVTPVAGLPVTAGGVLNCGAAVKTLN